MSLPLVHEDLQNEVHFTLWLCRPNTPAAESYERPLRDTFDETVGYLGGSTHNTLMFSTYTTTPGHAQLGEDWEIAVVWWDPRRRENREPPNSRFVVNNERTRLDDRVNTIHYTCLGTTWLLEKVMTRVADKFNTAWRLNRDEELAQEAYQDTERDFNSAFRAYENRAKRLQEDIWGHLNIRLGPIIVYERGLAWLIRNRVARWRSIVHNPRTGNLLWFSSDTGNWRGFGFTSRVERSEITEVRNLARDAYNARRAMERARNVYAAAQRANREGSSNGTRFFFNRTPARVLWQLWHEGMRRDAGYVNHGESTPGWSNSPYPLSNRVLKGLWRGWTQARDARGHRWVDTTTRRNWEVRLNTSLWAVLQDFRDRGEIDWRVGGPAPGGGGRSLYLVPFGSLTVNQTRRIGFKLDTNVLEAPEEVDRSEHQTVTFVLDSSGLNRYTYWNRGNSANQTKWGLFEGGIQEAEANSLATSLSLTRTKRQDLSRRFVRRSSRRVAVTPDQPIPMLDYEPNHIVAVHDMDGNATPQKISSIIVSKTESEGPITASVTLGERRTSRQANYARTLSKITGGSDTIQGHVLLDPVLTDSELPRDALFVPAISSINTRVRFDRDGRSEVMLSAQLAPHDIRPPEDAEQLDLTDEGQALIDETESDGI